MESVSGPSSGLADAAGSVSRQAAIHDHDRRELRVCKARLEGLQSFVRNERSVLSQIGSGD